MVWPLFEVQGQKFYLTELVSLEDAHSFLSFFSSTVLINIWAKLKQDQTPTFTQYTLLYVNGKCKSLTLPSTGLSAKFCMNIKILYQLFILIYNSNFDKHYYKCFHWGQITEPIPLELDNF